MTKFNIYDTDISPKTTFDFYSMKVEKFLRNINKCSMSKPVAVWSDTTELDFGRIKLVRPSNGKSQRRYRVTCSNVIPSGDYNYSTLINKIINIYDSTLVDVIVYDEAISEYNLPKDYPYIIAL